MKFKKGYKIELINDYGMAANIGATALIYRVSKRYINIVWDKNNPKRKEQQDGNYLRDAFKIIPNTWKERFKIKWKLMWHDIRHNKSRLITYTWFGLRW